MDGYSHSSPLEGGDDLSSLEISMKSLFGQYFKIKKDAEGIWTATPPLADAKKIMSLIFGPYVTEDDIVADSIDFAAKEFQENSLAIAMDSLEKYFGSFGAKSLLKDPIKSLAILKATLTPKHNSFSKNVTWLVEMPKIQPNRQTVHAAPQPFGRDSRTYLLSSSRMLYTPSNIMRWGYHAKSDTFLSNSRVIRWSDGSTTLHIGEDVYALNDWRSRAEVHLLGTETEIKQNGRRFPAFTADMAVSRHLVMDSADALSVQNAVAKENTTSLPENRKQKLGFTTAILPSINWEKPSKNRSIYEDFVSREYDKRKKEIIARFKKGQPMTLSEQMMMDGELAAILKAANEGAINLEQVSQSEEQVIHARSKKTPRSRFDRSINIEGGLPVDPFDDEEEAYSDGEEGYEDMLEAMQRKREREFEENVRSKKPKLDTSDHMEDLKRELETVIASLPSTSGAYEMLDGIIELIQTSGSSSMIKEEAQGAINIIARENPAMDISALKKIIAAVM